MPEAWLNDLASRLADLVDYLGTELAPDARSALSVAAMIVADCAALERSQDERCLAGALSA
jgi:hypothetical protein